MSGPAAALLAIAVWAVSRRVGPALAAGLGAAAPGPALAVGGSGLLLVTVRRLRAGRLGRDEAGADVALLAELTGMGLSAGLSLPNALAGAGRFVHPDLADEVEVVLRRAVGRGLAAALAESTGHGRRLYLICARAVTTGAPLGAALDAFVAELRADERAARLEAARRLPVRLMIPLALLILPGFVLLTVGPAVMAALERFALPR